MRIVWALLPDDAQEGISRQKSFLPTAAQLPLGAMISKVLRAQVGDHVFTTWFHTLQFEYFDGKTVTFRVPVRFVATWIKAHYRDELLRACKSVLPSTEKVDIRVRRLGVDDVD